MDDLIQTMMHLIRCEITQQPFPATDREGLSEDALTELYRLSKAHDLAHLVGAALDENHWLPDGLPVTEQFRKQAMLAAYRHEQLSYELGQIERVLEEAKLPFIPLKGAVLRQYYPQPWMRTSGDVDILVHEADLDRALGALTDALSYRSEGRGGHDVVLWAPSGVRVELHFNLIEERMSPQAERLLRDVWDHAQAEPESARYGLTDAFFYYYHIAHMAKHFARSGCGVRPLIDLWVLRHRQSYDAEQRERLLAESGLSTFEKAAARLSEVWFSDAEPDELTGTMQQFILRGGVYGSAENRASTQTKKKYLRSRIFLPYSVLKEQYPVLRKHKWLLPLMQARRWFRLLFKGKWGQLKKEAKANDAVDEASRLKTADMMQQLGL